MKWLFRGAVIAFFAGLGAAVAIRIGSEAMAVVVGVVLGIVGTLPVALLVLYAARRSEPREAEKPQTGTALQPWQGQGMAPAAPPQIIVVPTAQMPPMPRNMGGWYPQQAALPPVQREFNIVGEDG